MQLKTPESPITRKRDLDDVLTSRDEVFVLFYASWCPFCRKFLPLFEKTAAGKEGFVLVQDDQETLSDPYHVQIYPTVLFFRKGEVSKRLDGKPRVGLNETLTERFHPVVCYSVIRRARKRIPMRLSGLRPIKRPDKERFMKTSRFLLLLLFAAFMALWVAPCAAAAEKTIRLKIEACDCPTTVPQVNFILQTTPGIVKHDVNTFTREATVTFDDKKTSVETIRERLEKGGFPAEEVTAPGEGSLTDPRRQQLSSSASIRVRSCPTSDCE